MFHEVVSQRDAVRQMMDSFIEIQGARTHNLKNISVRIPLGQLTVITGVSGSGKSSLAFDTLYAEGQRRYVESLSTYARQFIEKMARPDVDHVRNIQPAIAIEQKNSVKNARSTIGTATEINDYLRLMYSKAGVTVCPEDGVEVREDNPQSVADEFLARRPGQRIYITAPLQPGGEVSPSLVREELLRAGFSRVYLEHSPPLTARSRKRRGQSVSNAAHGGRVLDIDEADISEFNSAFESGRVHVLVDRLIVDESERERIASSAALAFQAGHGTLEAFLEESATGEPRKLVFHAGFQCNICGRAFPRSEPNLFSFNSPIGACPQCSGFGRVIGIDWDKVIPDRSLTLEQKGIAPFNTPKYRKNYSWLKRSAAAMGVPLDVPFSEFTPEQWNRLLYGEGRHEGVKAFFDWAEEDRYKVQNRILIARYRGFAQCTKCNGTRLVPEALSVQWAPATGRLRQRNIAELTAMSIKDLLADFADVRLTEHEDALYGRVFREILSRLNYLVRVGLGYLTLDRQTRTLSGGEAQRINLATALGTSLTRTLYVLDEPTVGLHPRDTRRLLEILRDLRDKGNTIVVVEHDTDIIRGADHVIDLGPQAGSGGGAIIFSGSPSQLEANGSQSLTAGYLRGSRHEQEARATTSRHDRSIKIIGAQEHNLKNIDVPIPLGRWVCITGVSGSGKSTLMHNVLYQGFRQNKHLPADEAGKFKRIMGLEQLDEIVLIDQSPIGRSIRSNPVTYVKAYDVIRKLFASTREARTLGLSDSSFSFNVAGGRCERCEGTGVVTYDMHFLAEMTLPCDVCDGRRFQPRVLEVRYKDRNIDETLAMTVEDAMGFFADRAQIVRRLAPLREVGLGYLRLGQSTATLSGGEAQRLKLASYLTAEDSGKRTMMVFDEPTTGLHLADLDVLSLVFRGLLQRGYSLVIIEHNLEIIRQADWVIDLGPEGGDEGGYVVASGPPQAVAADPLSHTGRFLREMAR